MRRPGSRAGTTRARTPRSRTPTPSPTGSRRSPSSPTRRPSSCIPGRRGPRRHYRPTYALIDIDPGPKTTWHEVLVLARLYRTALGHLGVRGYPKVTGKRGIQVWVPVEPRYTFAETSAWVEELCRAVGGDGAGAHLVGMGGARPARPGTPRLHAERDQQDARRAVLGAARRHGAGLRADRLGRAR